MLHSWIKELIKGLYGKQMFGNTQKTGNYHKSSLLCSSSFNGLAMIIWLVCLDLEMNTSPPTTLMLSSYD